MSLKFPRRLPRMGGWLLIAKLLILAIAAVSPQQLPVALYKLALISLAAVVGYWIDRSLFPYARPDGYLSDDWRQSQCRADMDADHQVAPGYREVFAAALLRRALIVGAVVIGVALGL